MIKTKKRFWAMTIILLGIIQSLLMGLFTMSIGVSAETNYHPAERYTASDQLLQSDGTESSKDINDFSYTVKSGYNGQSFPELAQVVPLEYLESTDANAEFSYNGKEYGFYMAKEVKLFDHKK